MYNKTCSVFGLRIDSDFTETSGINLNPWCVEILKCKDAENVSSFFCAKPHLENFTSDIRCRNEKSVSWCPVGPQCSNLWAGGEETIVRRSLHCLRGGGLCQGPDFGFLTGDISCTFQSWLHVLRVTLVNFFDKCQLTVFMLLRHLQARIHRCWAERAFCAFADVCAVTLRLCLIPLIQVTFPQGAFIFVTLAFLLLILLVWFPLRRPTDPVLLLKSSSCVCEPGGDLREAHFSNDGEHDLLALGWIRVLQMLVQPGLERTGAFSGSHLGDPTGILGGAGSVRRVERPTTSQECVMVGRCGL